MPEPADRPVTAVLGAPRAIGSRARVAGGTRSHEPPRAWCAVRVKSSQVTDSDAAEAAPSPLGGLRPGASGGRGRDDGAHARPVAITDHILARLATRYRRSAVRISPEVRRLLAAYHWPGNTRELVNVLERAVILSQGDSIKPDHLPDCLLGRAPRAPADTPTNRLSLEELERQHIERVLADSGTLEEAATRLGINPTTLWRKRKRYHLRPVATSGGPPRRRCRPERRERPVLAAGPPGTGGSAE
jgi:Bacterial regulatory protein, Fis family